MLSLAAKINKQLLYLQTERQRFHHVDSGLKQAVTSISHDLRTPYTAISGYLDLLDRKEKSREVERYVNIIRERTDAMKALTVAVQKLFDRFYTGASGRISTGSGLSIAKLLTERMGGKIFADHTEKRLTISLTFNNSGKFQM